MTLPRLFMIAGPNGAGKTTLAYKALPSFFGVYEFVNADEIARGLSPFYPEGQAVKAGRLMLKRIDELIETGQSFGFETTAASTVFGTKIRQAKQKGYKFGLFFVWLPGSEMAKGRVKLRVSQGGHGVSEATIDRRYERGLENLIRLYLPLSDEAEIYNGAETEESDRRRIALKEQGKLTVYDETSWRSIVKWGLGGDDGRE